MGGRITSHLHPITQQDHVLERRCQHFSVLSCKRTWFTTAGFSPAGSYLTTTNRFLPEKLTIAQVVNEFKHFMKHKGLVTVFRNARHLSQSSAHPHLISLKFILILSSHTATSFKWSPSCRFPSQNACISHLSSTRATSHAHLVLLHLITLIKTDAQHYWLHSSG
jgi:hypothetical protein